MAVALHPGPETAVSKAVMGFGVMETLAQLTLGDVGDEADMSSGGLQALVHIEGGEIAAIPGAAEQGRELCLATFQRIEDGSELLGECEETTVGGRLLITQSVNQATGSEAAAGDTGGEPRGSTSAKRRAIWPNRCPCGNLLESPTASSFLSWSCLWPQGDVVVLALCVTRRGIP
jgi:hypothetical protein